jgi:hypothetical protein
MGQRWHRTSSAGDQVGQRWHRASSTGDQVGQVAPNQQGNKNHQLDVGLLCVIESCQQLR